MKEIILTKEELEYLTGEKILFGREDERNIISFSRKKMFFTELIELELKRINFSEGYLYCRLIKFPQREKLEKIALSGDNMKLLKYMTPPVLNIYFNELEKFKKLKNYRLNSYTVNHEMIIMEIKKLESAKQKKILKSEKSSLKTLAKVLDEF